MCLKKFTGASNLQGLSLPYFSVHLRQWGNTRKLPQKGWRHCTVPCGSFWCVSLWVLDTLSHFIIPIWQKEKQKLGKLERFARIALDIAAAALAWRPRKLLPPVLVLTFGFSKAVLPVAVVQTTSISWHKMAFQLKGCSTRPVSFPRKQLPTDDRLHFLMMKLWVSSLREWRSLSQSEKLVSVPHSAAVCGLSACLNLTIVQSPT